MWFHTKEDDIRLFYNFRIVQRRLYSKVLLNIDDSN